MPDDMWSSEDRLRMALVDMTIVGLQRSNDRLRDAIFAHRAAKLGLTGLGGTGLDPDPADLDLWDALDDEEGDDDD